MSAWMYSIMCPTWNGAFAYGRAVVTNNWRRESAGEAGEAGVEEALLIRRILGVDLRRRA
jgi:hypothetical protein